MNPEPRRPDSGSQLSSAVSPDPTDLLELRELAEFLASLELVESSMDLFAVDGFSAAILSGPRTLMPSEWIRWIWDRGRGEVAPEFENREQAQRILGLMMRQGARRSSAPGSRA